MKKFIAPLQYYRGGYEKLRPPLIIDKPEQLCEAYFGYSWQRSKILIRTATYQQVGSVQLY